MGTIIIILYVSLLAFNIWIFILRPRRPWNEKIGFLIQIVSLYTFALCVFAQTPVLEQAIGEDMTSSNFWKYIRGNAAFSAIFLGVFAQAADVSGALSLIEQLSLLFFMMLGFIYAVFHWLVIVPLAYIPYIIISAPVHSIAASPNDFLFSIAGYDISIKQLVTSNVVSWKSWSISLPTAVLAIALKALFFIKGKPPHEG